MAKTKKSEQIVEEVVETVDDKTEEVVKEKDYTEDFKKYNEEKSKKKKFVCMGDTPYLSEPNIFNNVTGILAKGTLCYVDSEIDNGSKGRFYKICSNRYVNADWNNIKMF